MEQRPIEDQISDPLFETILESYEPIIQTDRTMGENYKEIIQSPSSNSNLGSNQFNGSPSVKFNLSNSGDPGTAHLYDMRTSRLEINLHTYIGSTRTGGAGTQMFNKVPKLSSGLFSLGLGAKEGGLINKVITRIQNIEVSAGVTGSNFSAQTLLHMLMNYDEDEFVKIVQRGSIGGYNGIFDELTYEKDQTYEGFVMKNGEHGYIQEPSADPLVNTNTGIIEGSYLFNMIKGIPGVLEKMTRVAAAGAVPAYWRNDTLLPILVPIKLSIPISVLSSAFHQKNFRYITSYQLSSLELEIQFNPGTHMEVDNNIWIDDLRCFFTQYTLNVSKSNFMKRLSEKKNCKLVVNNSPFYPLDGNDERNITRNNITFTKTITGMHNPSALMFWTLLKNPPQLAAGSIANFSSVWEWMPLVNPITSLNGTRVYRSNISFIYNIEENTHIDLYYSALSKDIIPFKRNTFRRFGPLIISTPSVSGSSDYIISTESGRDMDLQFQRNVIFGNNLLARAFFGNAVNNYNIPADCLIIYFLPYTLIPYCYRGRTVTSSPTNPTLIVDTLTLSEKELDDETFDFASILDNRRIVIIK